VFVKSADDERTDHYAVTIAIDESGSMQMNPWNIALNSAVMIIEACSQMGIPTKVTRFDHAHWNVTDGWSVEHSEKEKGMIASNIRGGNNNDIPALTKFVKEAAADANETGRKHLVFMIGDGLGEEEMNEAAANLQKKTGVEIYGVVINNHSQGNKDQYPHAEMVKNIDDLPDVMKRLLKRYIGRRVI